MTQIARHLGLAQSTVSSVLNGRADELRISPQTQQLVRETAEELGYRPNASARTMRSGRFGNVALMQSSNRVYLPTPLLLGLTEGLSRQDMRLIVAETADAEMGQAIYLPKVMRELSVDGLFINVLRDVSSSVLDAVHALRVPAVWINTNAPADCVFPDDMMGATMATEYLLELGHQRIAYVKTGPLQIPEPHYSSTDRLDGYSRTMRKAGLPIQTLSLPELENPLTTGTTDGRVAECVKFLKSTQHPTAIIAYGDDAAYPMFVAAQQLQLRIPGDLSLMMFSPGIEYRLGIYLSSIIHNFQALGESASEMMKEKLEEPAKSIPSRALPPELFEGTTCGPPVAM
jgi:LacI family transcriptional regulator